MKTTAIMLAACMATGLSQTAGAQSAVSPVSLDQASTRAVRICLLNLTGSLPFVPSNMDAVVKAGAVLLPPPTDLQRFEASPEGAPSLASVPVISGRIGLASYPKVRMCRVMAFDDPEGAARKAVLTDLSGSKNFRQKNDETKNGIRLQSFEWPLKDDISVNVNVSGPEAPTDGGKGMQLMVTLAYTKSDKPN